MEMTIRPPAGGEFARVVECLTETRGPSYYTAEYYDEAYLRSGATELFAAFDKNGEVMGFAGLSEGLFNTMRTTGCLLTVRPGFSGQGVAKSLIGHFTGVLRERGALAVKGQAVSRHPVAQAIVESMGWTPTGFLYGARDNRNNTPPGEGKSALVLYTKELAPCDAGTLYVHPRMMDFAERIYTRAELYPKGQMMETILRCHRDIHNRALYLQALECGGDLLGKIADACARNPELTCVTVALNLGSPSAIPGAELLWDAGWRFCGIDPCGEYEHALFFSGDAGSALCLTEQAQRIQREADAL